MNESTANLIANAGIHFAILLAFWYIVYKKLAFGIAREAFRDQLKSPVLNLAQTGDTKYPILRNFKSTTYASQHQELSPAGKAKNEEQLRKIIYMILGVVVLLYFLPKVTKQNIHWGHLLKENAVTYLFVGIIELGFFIKVAKLYSPVLPTQLQTDLFGEVKKRVGC